MGLLLFFELGTLRWMCYNASPLAMWVRGGQRQGRAQCPPPSPTEPARPSPFFPERQALWSCPACDPQDPQARGLYPAACCLGGFLEPLELALPPLSRQKVPERARPGSNPHAVTGGRWCAHGPTPSAPGENSGAGSTLAGFPSLVTQPLWAATPPCITSPILRWGFLPLPKD